MRKVKKIILCQAYSLAFFSKRLNIEWVVK